MQSFSYKAKAELCRGTVQRLCCARAECYGALLYCNTFTMQEVRIIFSKRRLGAFRRRLPEESLAKAATITLLGTIVVFVGTFMLCVLEPQHSFVQLLFEQISAYSTAGLSMGITSSLHAASKAVLIVTMFIGRVGAFTLLSLWVSRPEPSAKYTEEAITIG